ncbi:HIT family protein [Actinomadura napierensis]|uniref:HIT domain-containing protein n=1 Tax=Actinomadura napierensis TaxID=267854 RepID=A0ABP5M478_9ACTN
MRPVVLEEALAEPSVQPGRECVLCPPLRYRINAMADLPGEASVIARDRDFLLMPDVAPLADGHLLLVTRRHRQCAGDFGEPLWDLALWWRDHVARLYRQAYGTGELLLFEHGPALSQGGGACIDHAHWHFLPGVHGIRAVVEGRGLPGTPAGYAALRARFRTGHSYLLIEEQGTATVHPGDGVRGQFLRWAVTVALHGETAGNAVPAMAWRWQETFGLPDSRRRFLRTVRAMRRAAAALDRPPDDDHRDDSHQ